MIIRKIIMLCFLIAMISGCKSEKNGDGVAPDATEEVSQPDLPVVDTEAEMSHSIDPLVEESREPLAIPVPSVETVTVPQITQTTRQTQSNVTLSSQTLEIAVVTDTPRIAIEQGLPSYPWPPETPSSRASISTLYPDIHENSINMDLRKISRLLAQSLNQAGYADYGFYSVPDGGFAMITRMEAIDSNGSMLADDKRYLLSDNQGVNYSFFEQLVHLFVAPRNFYRVIVFIVTDKTISFRNAELSEKNAIIRMQRAASRLPIHYSGRTYTANHDIYALIYEFEKSTQGDQLVISNPGRLGFNTHLKQSGIDQTLLKVF